MAQKAITEKQTKTEILATIAEETGLTRRQVADVLKSLAGVAHRHLGKRGSGEFSVPELGLKIRRIHKPAVKARKGINPFTKEPTTFKAKPARNVVKATILRALKDAAN